MLLWHKKAFNQWVILVDMSSRSSIHDSDFNSLTFLLKYTCLLLKPLHTHAEYIIVSFFNKHSFCFRRHVENAFGILASKWLYQKTIDLSPKNACCTMQWRRLVLPSWMCRLWGNLKFVNLRKGVRRQEKAATGMLLIRSARVWKSSQSAAVVCSVLFFFPWRTGTMAVEPARNPVRFLPLSGYFISCCILL